MVSGLLLLSISFCRKPVLVLLTGWQKYKGPRQITFSVSVSVDLKLSTGQSKANEMGFILCTFCWEAPQGGMIPLLERSDASGTLIIYHTCSEKVIRVECTSSSSTKSRVDAILG